MFIVNYDIHEGSRKMNTLLEGLTKDGIEYITKLIGFIVFCLTIVRTFLKIKGRTSIDRIIESKYTKNWQDFLEGFFLSIIVVSILFVTILIPRSGNRFEWLIELLPLLFVGICILTSFGLLYYFCRSKFLKQKNLNRLPFLFNNRVLNYIFRCNKDTKWLENTIVFNFMSFFMSIWTITYWYSDLIKEGLDKKEEWVFGLMILFVLLYYVTIYIFGLIYKYFNQVKYPKYKVKVLSEHEIRETFPKLYLQYFIDDNRQIYSNEFGTDGLDSKWFYLYYIKENILHCYTREE